MYLDSWRIMQAESLFDYAPGETTDTFTDRSFPAEPATTQSPPDADHLAAIAACTTAAVPADWFDACVLDVALSGNPTCASELAGAPPSDTAIDPAGGTVPLPSPIGGSVPAGSCVATGSMATPRLGFAARAVTLGNGKLRTLDSAIGVSDSRLERSQLLGGELDLVVFEAVDDAPSRARASSLMQVLRRLAPRDARGGRRVWREEVPGPAQGAAC